jgi:ADP-ribosylglycohydrolase
MRRDPTLALAGALVADALAMPVHWYYDRAAIVRDYGDLDRYLAPKNPHPDSILWRSRYTAPNERGEILHDQAAYWGQPGVHYHQFLAAGENTLNFQLARLLYRQVSAAGHYDPEAWLATYIDYLRTPGRHRDTYVEECHRGFFTRLAQGIPPALCGIEDGHIGGLAAVPALFAALPMVATADLRRMVATHVGLTHRHPRVLKAADTLVCLLAAVAAGQPLRETIETHAADWIPSQRLQAWAREDDLEVIGLHLSPACYIDQAFPAALYLAWKYHHDFTAGITANARVGGDNCHRGAVVGGLLGLTLGVPQPWLAGLHDPPEQPAEIPVPDGETTQWR